jgi:hypothetical protein
LQTRNICFYFVTQSAFKNKTMTSQEKQLQDLSEIRNIMERSTQFLSLSGLSGVFAGIYALLAAWFVYYDFAERNLQKLSGYNDLVNADVNSELIADKISYAIMIGVLVLGASIVTGYIFTKRKATKNGQNLWNSASKRMLVGLFVPLFAGGLFCLMLIKHNSFGLVAPATLIFYGLALINASKHTLREVKYLGLMQIVLGIIGAYFIGYGLLIWAIGFGVLHIVYGLAMYVKYDR